MEESRIRFARLQDSAFSSFLPLLHGAHKLTILYALMEYGTVRYNELKAYIGHISFKTLSIALKDLADAGFVLRREYPQRQPRVEYSLTEKGKTLVPVLTAMRTWGEEEQESRSAQPDL